MSHSNLHRRTLSTTSSKPLKTPRPPLVRGQSSPKLQSLGKKRATEVETTPEFDYEDPDMTFLQYCPSCDTQIIVPNSSILYCSESCRRKDSGFRPSNMSHETSFSPDAEDSSAPRVIVQPRSPSTLATFYSKPPVLHGFKADLDPTEWKPDSPTTPIAEEEPAGSSGLHHQRANSAAFNYLSQFHSSTASLFKACRPGLVSRASTSALPLARTAPSADTTPAMSAGNSTSSAESGFLRTPGGSSSTHAGTALRAYKRSSTYSATKKSVDLVKPVFDGPTCSTEHANCEESSPSGGLNYKKKKVVAAPANDPKGKMAVTGSLTKLLEGSVLAA